MMTATTLAITSLGAAPLTIPAPSIPEIEPRFDVGPSEITKLEPSCECDRCTNSLMLTRFSPDRQIYYGIISDLPESFKGYGVLYSTRDILDDCGTTSTPIPLDVRTQIKMPQFNAIDASFDVFFFHLQIKDKEQAQRLVVSVKNLGKESVTIEPQQIIKQEGIIGSVHEFESAIATRVMDNDWDRPISKVVIEPGTSEVIAYGKRFGNIDDGNDASRNVNCFGYVRAIINTADEDARPQLQVDVLAIPSTPKEEIKTEFVKWLDKAATTTDEVNMTTAPKGCALGRAVGVYPYGTIRSLPLVFDAAKLTADGYKFPMALPRVQTEGCPAAAQTLSLLLRPGNTREDTIGNYMIPYDVRMGFINTSDKPVKAQVLFEKTDADIGLAYRATTKTTEKRYKGVPVEWKWVGPKQTTTSAPFIQPITVQPKQQVTFSVNFMIIGNSSLPFNLCVRAAE
ncbi:hypothetical protein GX645_07355 [Candidatus Sumerlaeota bacterium]|nr:hypothetical protein [Candidatus Sumerlaeota bacterium]